MPKALNPNPVSPPAPKQTIDDKLDQIIVCLHRMDRRDRMRTIGGTIRSIIALIPLILFLASAWYIYEHSDALLQQITEEAAKQAAKFSPSNSNVMEQFKEYFGR